MEKIDYKERLDKLEKLYQEKQSKGEYSAAKDLWDTILHIREKVKELDEKQTDKKVA